jgi:nicotinate-nucleotide--dimethylbenzimidazole phosphoribosyltransferase
MDFSELDAIIPAPDDNAARESKHQWDDIAKPLESLGLLEDAVVRIAALTGTPDVRLGKRAVVVFCADNGVVSEGVTQTDSSVTMLVAENLTRSQTSVCRMAAVARADVVPVDMGMITRPTVSGIIDCRLGDGTKNFAREPAMTRTQASLGIERGIELVKTLKAQGYNILASGEMGIGNTTTSSAMAAALLRVPAETVTGRGAGLSDDSLRRKIEVIRGAIALHEPDSGDAFDVLRKLGGFDIAGMTGLFLGGAIHRVPIIIDGFISSVAAYTALTLCPRAKAAMIASHVSGEPAGKLMLDSLGLSPLIQAQMRLGEGTGAIAALPLLDMALAVYHGSSSFSDIGMEAYTDQTEGARA